MQLSSAHTSSNIFLYQQIHHKHTRPRVADVRSASSLKQFILQPISPIIHNLKILKVGGHTRETETSAKMASNDVKVNIIAKSVPFT